MLFCGTSWQAASAAPSASTARHWRAREGGRAAPGWRRVGQLILKRGVSGSARPRAGTGDAVMKPVRHADLKAEVVGIDAPALARRMPSAAAASTRALSI